MNQILENPKPVDGVDKLDMDILGLERKVYTLVTPPTKVIASCARVLETMQRIDWQGLSEQARDTQLAFNEIDRDLTQRIAILRETAQVVRKIEEAVQGMLTLIQSVVEMSASCFGNLSDQVSKLGEIRANVNGLVQKIQPASSNANAQETQSLGS